MTETLLAYGIVLLVASGVAYMVQAPVLITAACAIGATVAIFLGVIHGGDRS